MKIEEKDDDITELEKEGILFVYVCMKEWEGKIRVRDRKIEKARDKFI